jgi:hypothetical protein
MLRSATLVVGLILAGAAFVGFLMLGGMMAPEPYSVVVALRDIPAYSTLEADALGMDSQRINASVARALILREQVNAYLGGFVIEPIYAGEPLRKGAVVSPKNPQAAKRLTLMMTDPERVAMVIPVDAKTAPQQIESGDWVDVVVSLAPGNISAGRESTFASMLSTPTPVAFGAYAVPTPAFGPTRALAAAPTPTLAPTSANGALGVDAAQMNLPANKVVIQNVPVLTAKFQQAPNTSFAGSGFTTGGQQPSAPRPAYIKGDIQSVTVLIPRAATELLTFGIDNGRVHLALLPAQTGQEGEQSGVQLPTFGVTFNDWLAWMMRERAQATGANPITGVAPGAPRVQPPPNLPAQPTAVAAPPPNAPPAQPTQPAAQPAAPRPTAARPAQTNEIQSGLNFTALLIPLICGVVLIMVFIAVVRFVRKKRKQDALV